MTIKVNDGSTWYPQKSLKVHDGTLWNTAKKGWIYNGSLWSQFYPEYPLIITSPSVSGSATQGSTLTTTNGTWTSTDAYIPISYSYQWTRAGVDISGATSSTYATVVADVGNAVACKVTATNNRGATTITSSNSITPTSIVPGAPTGLSLSDGTTTPPTPGALTTSSVTQTSLNFSFGAATGSWTAYEVLTSNSNHVVSSLNQSTRTGSVTGGSAGESYYIVPYTYNTSTVVSMSWNAGTNATSYDVYIGGSFIANTTSTSYSYNTGSSGSKSVSVYSKNGSTPSATAATASITLSKKYSSPGTAASGNFLSNYTVTWNANGGTVSPTSSTVTPGSSVTAPTPTYSGYTFNGWYNASSGGSLIVNAGGSYTPSASITLYARWTVTPITPTINSLSVSTSDTAQTLMTVNWTSTNQSSWSISASPATGGASGGSSFSGTSQTSKYVGVGTPGTTYTFTLTITSSTGHTTSQSVNHTPPSGGSAPSTPTGLSNSYSTGPSWTGSWSASTGSGTITYYWTLYQSSSNGGSINATASGNTTGTSFTQAMNSANGLWAYFTVYAQNSSGTSGTATSGWA